VTASAPARQRVRFPGISPRTYEHPADRTALVALRRLTGFDTTLRVMAGAFNGDRFGRRGNGGSNGDANGDGDAPT
jgi:hypothetical protein